jgi:ATP-dependent exoDNAse (exonuclease V) beta subunit
LQDIDNEEFVYSNNGVDTKLNVGIISLKKELENTQLSERYRNELERTFIENINLLYVALTRPTQRLYMLTPKSKPKKQKDDKKLKEESTLIEEKVTITQLLQNYCQNLGIWDEEMDSYVIKEGLPNLTKLPTQKNEVSCNIDQINASDFKERISLRTTAERVFDLENFENSRDWGNKVHYVLSLIKTSDDIDNAIYQYTSLGYLNEEESTKMRLDILKIINLPQIAFLFEKGNQIDNEKEIISKGRSFRTDRTVLLPTGQLIIVDYKTGVKSESHNKQVELYIKLYLAMGYKNIKGILIYLESLEIVELSV